MIQPRFIGLSAPMDYTAFWRRRKILGSEILGSVLKINLLAVRLNRETSAEHHNDEQARDTDWPDADAVLGF